MVLGHLLEKKAGMRLYSGSSLDRIKYKHDDPDTELDLKHHLKIKKSLKIEKVKKIKQQRMMSGRTKTKIRLKLHAFGQIFKHLTFVTLTFANIVSDEVAVVVLRKFLDNVKKRSIDFQYLWVAERQTNNKSFEGNIHFHLVTNKYWDIKKHWKYWLALQAKHGIIPRNSEYKPSSAFDVRIISTENPRQLGMYLTKYITKNRSKFDCQVWNCSKKVSALYTAFYTDYRFLEELRRLKGDAIKEIPLEYCNLHIIPIDRSTIRFYDRLEVRNKQVQKLVFKE